MIELNHINDQNYLKDIVLTLTTKYNIDYLFLRENPSVENRENQYEIVILLSNKELRSIVEMDGMITADLLKYTNFYHIIFVSAFVKDRLAQKNVFFSFSCQPNKTLFKNPSSSFELYPGEFIDTIDVVEFERNIEIQNFKISQFMNGFKICREKRDFTMAAFMLQQVFEFQYRYLEIFMLGKAKNSHNIRSHHRYLKGTTGLLNSIFSESNEHDQQLLSLLNESYCAVRYESTYTLSEQEISMLENKMNALLKFAENLFNDCLNTFQTRENPNQKAEIMTLQQKETQSMEFPEYPFLNEILHKIHNSLNIKEIYLISSRIEQCNHDNMELIAASNLSVDYVLLLISETDIQEEISSFQNNLNGSPKYYVHLLGHNKLEIQDELKKNKWFFMHALQTAKPLYKEGAGIMWTLSGESERVVSRKKLERLRSDWEERIDRAEGFLECADVIGNIENLSSKISMYNLALEQIFLGLLEYFYDYRPHKFSLRSLFPLVEGLWKFPLEIFPKNTVEEQKRRKMLMRILIDTRIHPKLVINWSEQNLISKRCYCFKNEAISLFKENYKILIANSSEN